MGMTGWLPVVPLSRLPVGKSLKGMDIETGNFRPRLARACPVRGRRLCLYLDAQPHNWFIGRPGRNLSVQIVNSAGIVR